MLRILTGREDLHVKAVRTQYAIRNLVGHSVVLDGYAEDEEHKGISKTPCRTSARQGF